MFKLFFLGDLAKPLINQRVARCSNFFATQRSKSLGFCEDAGFHLTKLGHRTSIPPGFTEPTMAQLVLPLFPSGATEITPTLSFSRVDQTVTYFHSGMPIFSHDQNERASLSFHHSTTARHRRATQVRLSEATCWCCVTWLHGGYMTHQKKHTTDLIVGFSIPMWVYLVVKGGSNLNQSHTQARFLAQMNAILRCPIVTDQS